MEASDKTVRAVFVIGPTATGKTGLGVRLAHCFNGEIISADSRQVYRGLDIGTGKDLAEYSQVSPPVKHHLIDIVEPTAEYNLHRFRQDAVAAIADIHSRRRLPFVVGGTPLYIKALLDDYELAGPPPDPELRRRLQSLSKEQLVGYLHRLTPSRSGDSELNSRPRIIRAIEVALSPAAAGDGLRFPVEPLIVAPYYSRATVHQRILQRLDQRLAQGMIGEVERLHASGVSWEKLDYFGLEYRYVAWYLRGMLGLEEMREQLLVRIRRFAKAQDVWYRRFERDGWPIHWLPDGDFAAAAGLVELFISGEHVPEPRIRLDNILYGPRSQ